MLAIFCALIVAVPAAWIGGHEFLAPVGILMAGTGATFLTAVVLYVPRPLDVAFAYDRRAKLKERLSTATAELRNVDAGIRDLQRADALAVAQHLDPRQQFPFGGSRRDLVVLTIATTALAGWIMVSNLNSFFGSVRTPLLLGPGAATLSKMGAAMPEDPVSEAADLQSAMRQPAIATEIERIQAAIKELRAQINPDVVHAQRALHEASESLRLSNEGRQLGRELGKKEYDAAADELRILVDKLTEWNAAQREELGERFGESAVVATEDARLAQQFDGLAEVLQGGQISDARSALIELARTLEAIADSADGNAGMQQKLSELESRLSGLLGGAMLVTGSPGESEVDGSGVVGPSGLQSDGEGQRQGLTQTRARGFGDAATEGQEVPASIEGMLADQRLNLDGQLETVHIEPTEDGGKSVERPVLELGIDPLQSYEPSAGGRGAAVGRPDTDRELPADLQILLDRYFSTS
jgi:hypothetical protein